MSKLPIEYYRQEDVLFLSKDLLGKFLMTKIGPEVTGGMIIETEAYRAPEDRASHAYGYKRTKRNAPMYLQGGIAYVYQCYGIHALFNIVTNDFDHPHAVLIRGIIASDGIPTILKRRGSSKLTPSLAVGPGKVSQALGITLEHNTLPLTGPKIWVEDRGIQVSDNAIIVGPRVGVDYAGKDALLPWRFRLPLNFMKL